MPNFKSSIELLFVGISFCFSMFATYAASGTGKTASHIETEVLKLYESINCNSHEPPEYEIFRRALAGYFELEQIHYRLSAKRIITIIDFRKSANLKRLWVIDLKNRKILY